MIDEVVKILNEYEQGITTPLERQNSLINLLEYVSPAELYKSLPKEICIEITEFITQFLNVPPEKVDIIEGVTVSNVDVYRKHKALRIAKINALRPKMKEFLLIGEQSCNCQ